MLFNHRSYGIEASSKQHHESLISLPKLDLPVEGIHYMNTLAIVFARKSQTTDRVLKKLDKINFRLSHDLIHRISRGFSVDGLLWPSESLMVREPEVQNESH